MVIERSDTDRTRHRHDRAALDAPGDSRAMIFRLFMIRPSERALVAWSTLYFFFLLAGNFVLRPLRDATGIKEGLDTLPGLLTGTLVAMAIAIPVYNVAISHLPRGEIVSWVHRFGEVSFLALLVALRWHQPVAKSALNWVVFIWLSVFNLVSVTALRTLMADIWSERDAKRLFGFVSAGGTLGAIAGAQAAKLVALHGSTWWFPALSIGFLELSTLCAHRALGLRPLRVTEPAHPPEAVAGNLAGGLRDLVETPLLRGIAGLVLLTNVCTTLLYVEQAHIVKDQFSDMASRTAALANIERTTLTFALAMELLVTGRFVRVFGVRYGLFSLPAATALFFLLQRFYPVFWVLIASLGSVRALNYGLATPAREVLFTVLPRRAKFRAKSVLDTIVWRTGDFIGIWARSAVVGLHVSVDAFAVAVAIVWGSVALRLGRTPTAHETQPAI